MSMLRPVAYTSSPSFRQLQQPLTMEALRSAAPSVFASAPHSSRSKNYTFFDTSLLVEEMIAAGFQPFSASQSRTRIEGKSDFTKHMIRFRSMSGKQDLIVGDVIPEIVLVNSHDGTSSYQISAGFHRLACLNGMMVSEGMQDSIRVHHKGDVVGQVIDASIQILTNMGRSAEAIKEWNTLQLTAGEQKAFAEVAHNLRFADAEGVATTPITPEQLLTTRRYEDNGDTLWKVTNRVQENVIRGGLTARAPRRAGERRGRMVTTRQVTGIDQDSRLNRAIWSLTEKMAELKSTAPAELAAA